MGSVAFLPSCPGGYVWWVPPCFLVLVDRRLMSHIGAPPDFGGTCASCRCFGPEVELAAGREVVGDGRPPVAEDEEVFQQVDGGCLRYLPWIVTGMVSTDCCPHHRERPRGEQFEDGTVAVAVDPAAAAFLAAGGR